MLERPLQLLIPVRLLLLRALEFSFFTFYGGVNPPLLIPQAPLTGDLGAPSVPLIVVFGAKKTTLVQNLHRAVLAERSLKPLA